VAAFAGATVAGTAQASVATASNVLGPKQPAKGTPVKIGFVTEDKFASGDNSVETPVANATAAWINQYRNGVGGHPIELVRCVSGGEAGKTADCANQMIAANVAAVVTGGIGNFAALWTPLHDAGVPVFAFAAGGSAVVADTASTFLFSPLAESLTVMNLGAAKQHKAKKVTAVVIDVPAATQPLKDSTPEYDKAKVQLELVPVAPGTADMTAQMQRVVSTNPDGVVFVIGNDAFCIAAFNGLRTAGFKGTITTVPFCLSDATRTAVPGDFLKGMTISSAAPIDNPKDPSMKQYYAVLKKFGAGDVDTTRTETMSMFTGLSGLNIATQNLKGDATPQSIIAAAKSMPWTVMPGTGGLHAKCGGNAVPSLPAACMRATLASELDSTGKSTKYTPVGDTEIP
jgi:branched-chain amino acid transport system substrate-binding protein